jgi:hypothetical protein
VTRLSASIAEVLVEPNYLRLRDADSYPAGILIDGYRASLFRWVRTPMSALAFIN